MIYRVLMIFGVIFTLNGCFHVGSSTEIIINDVTKIEYEKIKKDVRNRVTALNPPFDCESDKEYWKANREKGELICNNGTLYTEMNENNVNIIYSGGTEFWVPTKMIITNEHKKIQKLFLELASKYKKKYKNVSLIFYHNDLPKEGRKLL